MGTLRPLGASTDRPANSAARGHFSVNVGSAVELRRLSRCSRASGNVVAQAGVSTLQHPSVYHSSLALTAEVASRRVHATSPREARVSATELDLRGANPIFLLKPLPIIFVL